MITLLMLQSVFLWNPLCKLSSWESLAIAFTCCSPCFCGTPCASLKKVLESQENDVRLQSVFLWNPLCKRTVVIDAVFPAELQSVFLWNPLCKDNRIGFDLLRNLVAVRVFVEPLVQDS